MVPIEISYSLIKRRRLSGKGFQNGEENDCKKDFQFNTTRQMLQTSLSCHRRFVLKTSIPYVFQLFFLFEYL